MKKKENVAFKCAFNDYGFSDKCSKKLCNYNWKNGSPWCKRQFKDKLGCYLGNDFHCMEKELFKVYSFGAGSFHMGEKAGEKVSIKDVKVGKIAFLTTLKPLTDSEGNYIKNSEKNRYFFGLLDIAELRENPDSKKKNRYNAVIGNKDTSIIINPKVKVKFWDFYENDNAKNVNYKKNWWGCRRIRYLSDEQTLAILIKLKEEYLKKNLEQSEIGKIQNLITRFQR